MTWQPESESLEREVERWRTAHDALLERSLRIDLPDEVIRHIVQQYELRYEELSDDPFEDAEGGMSRKEKEQRSCIAVRVAMRHYFQTGKLVHWRDAQPRAALGEEGR